MSGESQVSVIYNYDVGGVSEREKFEFVKLGKEAASIEVEYV